MPYATGKESGGWLNAMSLLNIDSYKDVINNKVQDKVKELSLSLKNNIVYDAQVEGIDLSKINVSFEKVDDDNFNLVIDLGDLNDYYKHLAKDVYLPNGLKRRKW